MKRFDELTAAMDQALLDPLLGLGTSATLIDGSHKKVINGFDSVPEQHGTLGRKFNEVAKGIKQTHHTCYFQVLKADAPPQKNGLMIELNQQLYVIADQYPIDNELVELVLNRKPETTYDGSLFRN
ncbi:hypothetical protein [Spartinivicinus ruber]|uniref:hypothetical protein n=1 Tax=Spartinivicinus ruber TaxID=2683272 RepID=UPI0013D894AC|nr:hypothetical protein [Spartinivicinus ruber]